MMDGYKEFHEKARKNEESNLEFEIAMAKHDLIQKQINAGINILCKQVEHNTLALFFSR